MVLEDSSGNRVKCPHVSESFKAPKRQKAWVRLAMRKHFCLRHVKQPESKKAYSQSV
jgi:hypothetical protein